MAEALTDEQACERIAELVVGLRDATSEGDGQDCRLLKTDVSELLQEANNDTEAVLRALLFDGQAPDLEERLVQEDLSEVSAQDCARGMVYYDEEDNQPENSEAIVASRIAEVLDVLRAVSIDGKGYNFAYATDVAMYTYGFLTISRSGTGIGWACPDAVWT
ncbi:hypothetical protein PTSG_02195 [Salpingoeca rosetta]|uniref:Uncharacterized protein n=1 Tax=Salpingoeca rosetta (strain ATCC 50818 / BSB-021) TaxID=946362 RepID=F2U1H5_SALR5|nr:uncharacterized protein PTSG_02195 [Salpingoeca rosetta]EGD81477.1 hypothetical protein PTSG_02195 [Salpingoeca rosetta]|eukprot:XP_004996681.1 hypothetical protein PTSG_02195 [Salpingoeca rosetta]